MLVGDLVTLISPAKGLDKKAFKAKQQEWQKEFNAALAKLNSSKDANQQNEAIQRYRELSGKRSEFMNEEMTGFVWLYLQK